MEQLKLKPSSNVESAFYDASKRELVVTFSGNRKYTYHKVPPDTVKDLIESDSAGSFINHNVAKRFDFTKHEKK